MNVREAPTRAGASRPGSTDSPPAIKICGITRPADAVAACELGAAAIGFVFWPGSPRVVTPAAARAIVRELPPFVATVGVFVNQPREAVLEIAASVPLTAVQFHGEEEDEWVAAFPWRVVRACSIHSPAAGARLARLPHDVTVLLDAHDPDRRGGTGATIDWTRAAAVAARRRILLAGGLRSDNVATALRTVRPWGLDVSSGVESAPGVKDLEKLRAFFAAVNAAAGAETNGR